MTLIRRRTLKMSPTAISAVACVGPKGVLTTMMPSSVAASWSTPSMPTPQREMTLSSGRDFMASREMVSVPTTTPMQPAKTSVTSSGESFRSYRLRRTSYPASSSRRMGVLSYTPNEDGVKAIVCLALIIKSTSISSEAIDDTGHAELLLSGFTCHGSQKFHCLLKRVRPLPIAICVDEISVFEPCHVP